MAPSRVEEEIQVNLPPFDRVFVLTMRRLLNNSNGRFSATEEHLRSVGILAEPFISFDAEITGLETRHTYERDHPGTNFRVAPRMVNMYLGHYTLWKVCEYLPGDSFLILEDDVRFSDDWKQHLAAAMPLPSDWDLIYLGSCCCMDKAGIKQITGRLNRVQFALCTHAYAVRKKAIPILLENCERIEAGIDIAICLNAMPKLNAYAFLPRIADQIGMNLSP